MNIQSLAKGLKYIGEAEGKRQTYYIFEGHDFYFVLSFKKNNPNAGNFNVVEMEAIRSVQNKFGGAAGITTSEVYAGLCKTRARYFSSELDALKALYVLVGLGQAKVDTRHKATSLFFNIK